MTKDPPTPIVRPEGFDFEQPDESWLARVRQALAGGESDSAETAAATDPGGCATGARLGPYELIRQIGAGGMGTVWLARRADGAFQRNVAIKLIKRGMDTDAVLRRFQTERHMLATLLHPHIARLYDGGSTPDGRPFLVMEYVEGLPILDYCEARGLDIEPRLRLFRSVCLAVHHAHSHLILHRDLKPGNILVVDDCELRNADWELKDAPAVPSAIPKVLDFGIAKLLNEDGIEGTVHTATDIRALTPRYASPEQVRGERLTTAADVYSLGVVLYELLAGRSPYHLESGLHAEIERAVLVQEPPRPSAAASRRDDLPPGQGHRLQRRLRGDLDTIVMTALEKDQARRYSSAGQLAEDIRRHLEGLPLLARRAGPARRLLRAVRRNRATLTVASVAALVGLAISASVLTYWFLAPRRAQEHVRRAHVALLNPEQANAMWVATFFYDQSLSSRDRPPRGDVSALRAALTEYDRALRFDSSDPQIQQERDTMWLALTITESAAAPSPSDRLQRTAPLTCGYAAQWSSAGRVPELTEAQLDSAAQSDLRCLGLLTLLTAEFPDALRAWSRLAELEADPLIEGLFGVLHLGMEQPERAYPRLLSAYRQYPECGFLGAHLAEAALDCGDVALAGALLDKADALEKHDDVLGLDRVRMRYYLATDQEARATELIASRPLIQHNPVAAVQYAQHRFQKGEHREALELLGGPWCIAPVGWPQRFSPFTINREYLRLTQRWWAGLDRSELEMLLHEAMDESAASLRSVFRIFHEYRKCTQRLESVRPGASVAAGVIAPPVLSELTTETHRELLDWYGRLEIDNAYRWRQFSEYPPELRRLQVQAWLAPEQNPSAGEIAEKFQAWRRERGLDIEPPYTKLLPAGSEERWARARVSGALALIAAGKTAHVFRETDGGWQRQESLAAPPDMSLWRAELDEDFAVLVYRPDEPAGGAPGRLLTYRFDASAVSWRLLSDQAFAELASGGFGSADGIAVITPGGHLDQTHPRAVSVLRWNSDSCTWAHEQTLADWSAQPGRLNFLRPAIASDVMVIGTMCPAEPWCDAALDVYQYDARAGRWSRKARLLPPDPHREADWGSVAVTTDILVASGGRAAKYDVYVYRRNVGGTEWRLEQRLCDLLPSPPSYLGYFSLDVDGTRVTAAAGTFADLHDWHTDVYVFEYDHAAHNWSYAGSARPLDRGFGDAFGEHDLSGDTLIVGASGHDAAGIDAGAAYIFDIAHGLYHSR